MSIKRGILRSIKDSISGVGSYEKGKEEASKHELAQLLCDLLGVENKAGLEGGLEGGPETWIASVEALLNERKGDKDDE